MATLTWLDRLLFGLRQIFFGGSALPDRPALEFTGAGVTVEDDPTNNRTRVTIGGAGASSGGSVSRTITTSDFAASTEVGLPLVLDVPTSDLPADAIVIGARVSGASFTSTTEAAVVLQIGSAAYPESVAGGFYVTLPLPTELLRGRSAPSLVFANSRVRARFAPDGDFALAELDGGGPLTITIYYLRLEAT